MKKTISMHFKTKFFAYLCTSIILTACGGGGNGTLPSVTAIATAPPLAVYVGTWKSECISHEQGTSVFSMPSTSTGILEVNFRSDFYDGVNCTGPILGTITRSVSSTISYVKTADVIAAIPPSSVATSIRADQININSPASFETLEGVGVRNVVTNGIARWCISFSNGDETCVTNFGLKQARTVSGAFYLRQNELFLLSPNGTGYDVERLTRK